MPKGKAPPIGGISLDLEGTLIDLEEFHFEAFVNAASEHGYTITVDEIVGQHPYVVGGGDERVAEAVREVCNLGLTIQEIRRSKNAHFTKLVNGRSIRLRADAERVLAQAQRLGLKLAIGSLTDRARAMHLINETGLLQYVRPEYIVLFEDVAHHKPEPDVYLETARRMGIDPTEQLVFEDSNTGIEAARRARSARVAIPIFQTKEYLERLVEAGASRIFGSWREINLEGLIESINEGNR